MTFQLENIFKHNEKHTSCIIFVYHTLVNENARLICDTKKGIDHIYGIEVYTCHAKVERKFKQETIHYYK